MIPEYNDSIFINCPFDDEYQAFFDAIVFAGYRSKFLPRCALEISDGGENRISKIYQIIEECRLAIHDISRTTLSDEGLPRFNMPLEYGIFLGARRYGGRDQKSKRCLVLDTTQYRYQKFISDIAGQDVEAHNDDPRQAVIKVRDWLATIRGDIPSGSLIWEDYERFRDVLPTICMDFNLVPTELTFTDYVRVIYEWLRSNVDFN